ncbi:hypothetical protein DH2020_027806 [Rehmannia glutinosa]|uniref:Rho-GAP domain-containing protein n=1 Tax=Rehmannia glutinosa TaxID=99300 RepID=A0ABR0VT86_REHGL
MGEFSGAGGGVMEISWPSDVEHVNHVTFDRFDGFLGLPVEFEPEVPRRAPSARAEGIFRITAGNSQEEFVRDQLNRGVVPQGIDVHCLAGLIKAWFRELPRGVLDSLSPEQVMQCQSEDDCFALVRLLPPTEAALLDWAINLMADVVQVEHLNKMNARNIAMVFAPNMTQSELPFPTRAEDDDNGHHSSSRLDQENRAELNEEPVRKFVADDDPGSETSQSDNIITDEDYPSYSTYTEESDESGSCETTPNEVYRVTGNGVMKCLRKTCRSSDSNNTGFESRIETQQGSGLATKVDKERKGISKVELYNPQSERKWNFKHSSGENWESHIKLLPYGQKKQYRHSDSFSSMNSESLSVCTEGLGFESFGDAEDLVRNEICNNNDNDCQFQEEKKTSFARNRPAENENHWGESKRLRTSIGEFPPPVSCIGRSGKPFVSFKSFRQDGRIIIKEIRIPTQELLHACREWALEVAVNSA